MTEANALQLAYAYLNRRERTEAEMRAYLAGRELDAGAVEAALAELLEFGYIDDARYARCFTEDKRNLEGWGEERIRRSLRERGVDRDLIDAVIAQANDDDGGAGESEFDRAAALLRRRFPEPPRDRRDRDRALGVMVRKGFDPDLALDVLSAYARGSLEE